MNYKSITIYELASVRSHGFETEADVRPREASGIS